MAETLMAWPQWRTQRFADCVLPERLESAERRFWAKVEKTETCWLWTGHINRDGYGLLEIRTAEGKRAYFRAHRVSYELLVGDITAGLELDHLCRVKHCVAPHHLEPVTTEVNVNRQQSGSDEPKTHCKNGHPFDESNTYRGYKGWRSCRACRAVWERERGTKKAAASRG